MIKEYVSWLDVSVNYTFRMSKRETLEDLVNVDSYIFLGKHRIESPELHISNVFHDYCGGSSWGVNHVVEELNDAGVTS